MRLYLVKDHQLIKFIQDDMYMYTSFYFSGLLDKYMYLHAATTVAIHFHMYITKDSWTSSKIKINHTVALVNISSCFRHLHEIAYTHPPGVPNRTRPTKSLLPANIYGMADIYRERGKTHIIILYYMIMIS